ncbi:MAG: hypothetical protein NW200_07715 [Hyphomonadaceae bacterium]|nr:hypothetical protein [Hyphomonadaceae bacterium]
MRALFAQGARPPMGDEDFVQSVMTRVQDVRAADKVRRNVAVLGATAFAGAVLWPFRDALGAGITLSMARFAHDVPMLSGGATALLIAAAATLAALAYTERS